MSINRRLPRAIVPGLVMLFCFGGCASFGRKFKESKSVNFTPFAEQTLVLLASLDYEMHPNEIHLIRPFADLEDPALIELRARVQLERTFLKGILAYSMEIVHLSESGKPPEDQVKEYRDYLAGLSRTVQVKELTDVRMSPEQVQGVLESIAAKRTLLEAMQAARPLIVEFNKVNLRLIRDIAEFRALFVEHVNTAMDEKFKAYLSAEQSLRAEKAEALAGLDSVRAHKQGRPDALEELSKTRGLLPKGLARGDAAGIERHLAGRLSELTKRQEEVQRDLNAYRDLKNKLDQMQVQHDEMIRSGGRAVLLWSRAHQKMADGVTNPAEWFGWSDLKSTLTGAAKKALP